MPRSTRPDMAGCGVGQGPKGLLDWAWAEQRLLTERNFWFVTAGLVVQPCPVTGGVSRQRCLGRSG